eukprot:5412694-Amphidinium_carterae.1
MEKPPKTPKCKNNGEISSNHAFRIDLFSIFGTPCSFNCSIFGALVLWGGLHRATAQHSCQRHGAERAIARTAKPCTLCTIADLHLYLGPAMTICTAAERVSSGQATENRAECF